MIFILPDQIYPKVMTCKANKGLILVIRVWLRIQNQINLLIVIEEFAVVTIMLHSLTSLN